MSEFDLLSLAGLGGIAFLAGFIDAVAGGGGMLIMPTLLSIGMPVQLVLGTNKLISTFGTTIASLTFIRRGLFHPRRWWRCALATFIGASLGAGLIYQVEPRLLKTILPLAVIAAALYSLWPRRLAPEHHTPQLSTPRQLGSGLGIGFYDGFIGPGTGAFWTLAGLRVFNLELVAASGVARFMNLISNAAALLLFASLGAVDWRIGAAMGLALMSGAWLGAHSAIHWGAKFIRPVFIVVVVAMAGRLVWREFMA